MAEKPVRPSREELLDHYKIAVEEYRFQVKLNADRSRDYVVLNSAIIAAGVALLGQSQHPYLAGAVFLVGMGVAALSILGSHTQHGYYRDTRNAKDQLARQLGIAHMVTMGTKSTGSRRRRFASVTTFNQVILSLLFMVDLAGALSGFGVIPRPQTSPPGMAHIATPQPGATVSVHPLPATPRHR